MIEPTFLNVCGVLFCIVVGIYVLLRICEACGKWEEGQITGGSTFLSTKHHNGLLELIPCPWCGEDSSYSPTLRFESTKWFVMCEDCGIRGPVAIERTNAVFLWNTRLGWFVR